MKDQILQKIAGAVFSVKGLSCPHGGYCRWPPAGSVGTGWIDTERSAGGWVYDAAYRNRTVEDVINSANVYQAEQQFVYDRHVSAYYEAAVYRGL